MDNSATEIAHLFDLGAPPATNVPREIYPGYPGLVLSTHAIRSMVWGFPLAQKSKRTGKPLKPRPINNMRADKLDNFFWRDSFAKRRCLIPVTAFAEAEGEKGSKTRTWFAHPHDEPLVCAGIWRDSDEWGPVYSMVMTEANETVAPTHDRMPVILRTGDRQTWHDGTPEEAKQLCVPYTGRLTIDRTDEPWNR